MRAPVRHADESAGPTATLMDVDIRSELSARPARPPDSEGLDLALAVLAREMNGLEVAEEANHRKDESVAMVGHELRNPLAAICNAAHILQEMDTAGHATAVQALSRFKPDVVLLDVGLPGMDGYQVAHRKREATLESKLTVIALTGFGQTADHRSMLGAEPRGMSGVFNPGQIPEGVWRIETV